MFGVYVLDIVHIYNDYKYKYTQLGGLPQKQLKVNNLVVYIVFIVYPTSTTYTKAQFGTVNCTSCKACVNNILHIGVYDEM